MRDRRIRDVVRSGSVPLLTLIVLITGQSQPGPVPVMHPTRLAAWWSSSGPVVSTFGVLRLAVLVVGVYWTSLIVLIRVIKASAGLRSLPHTLPWWMCPGLRSSLRIVAGTSIAGASLMNAVVPAANASDKTGRRSHAVASAPSSELAPRLVPLTTSTTVPAVPVLEAEVGRDEPPPGVSGLSPAPTPGATASRRIPSSITPRGMDPRGSPATWTVKPGDNLWSIAESVVAAHLGRTPRTREIAPYWDRLIEANRPRLPDPDNPSLIFSGEVMALPPL